MHQEIDKERYRSSISSLYDIFKGMSNTVTRVSKWRCPYKNVEARCTAGFNCRNQDRSVSEGEMFICIGSDDLDYRSAWEI